MTRALFEIIEFLSKNEEKIVEKGQINFKIENLCYEIQFSVFFVSKNHGSNFQNFQNCGNFGHTIRSLFGRLVSLKLMYGSYFSSRQVEYREYREYRIETQKWLEVEEDLWLLKIPFWRI